MVDYNQNSIDTDEQIQKITNNKLSIDDFTILKVIGKGSYGKVMLVKKRGENQAYAMKVLKKEQMMKKKQVEHIKTERKILELIDHPFIVKLKYAFQNEYKLYLVMEYCQGGEIFFHIQRVDRFSEQVVKFYAAQLILAIEHLHKNHIIYRDLKPENVLIASDGYVKLTDFGLSKENICDNHSANSFCGTPEYLAPEVIEAKGHGQAVDWWSLGAIMYEMLTGRPPFYAKDREKLFNSIKKGQVQFPKSASQEIVSLLEGLFTVDPDKRLGSEPNGVFDIQSHPFFKEINWEAIYYKSIKPPFKPRVQSDTDTKYVDEDFTKCSPKDSSVTNENVGEGNNTITNEDNAYKDFSYNPQDSKSPKDENDHDPMNDI